MAARRQAGTSGTKIKCCGMFREADIAAVNAARPDFCGFVVDFPKSHRSVTPERARELAGLLDPGIEAVGVFVDEDIATIADLVADGTLGAVQLHGHETDAYIAELRDALAAAADGDPRAADATIVRAFKVRGSSDIAAANASTADLVLLDNGQGTGEAFDWGFAEGIERPYVLAGGLSPGNIAEAVRRLHPFAVDLSSGLETGGVKDPEKIEQAVRLVRSL